MSKKTLMELNLLDNFLFGVTVSHAEYGERFSRKLLEIIFQRKINTLVVVPQKVYYGKDTNLHGTRLDVFLNETGSDIMENATVYDVEPEKKEQKKLSLPRRTRFYRSKMDAGLLKSGQDYDKLKNAVIIMIMPFDPFGLERMIYTIQSRCMEEPDMPYDDGAVTIYLYTGGKNGDAPDSLKELLHYMEDTCSDNAVNPDLKELDEIVQKVKQDTEVSISYMRLWEDEEEIRQEAREEGLAEGLAEGRTEGRAEAQRILIDVCREINLSQEDILKRLVDKFEITEEQGKELMAKYWKD